MAEHGLPEPIFDGQHVTLPAPRDPTADYGLSILADAALSSDKPVWFVREDYVRQAISDKERNLGS